MPVSCGGSPRSSALSSALVQESIIRYWGGSDNPGLETDYEEIVFTLEME